LDYNSTFALTARSSTICVLLSIAGTYDLEFRNYDIVSAFLGSKLKEDIWVMLPAGVRGFQKGQVVKLLASVYGLKQAARCWWKTLDEHLRGIGFRATVVDPCLYYRWIEDRYWLMALVVDDMILATNDTSGLFGKELGKRFEVKDMGDLAWCLGMQITRCRKEKYVFCSQEAYCKKILRDFASHLNGRKPVSTPGDGNKKLSKDQCIMVDPGKATAVPLASAVGALLYLARQTRPDISYSVAVISRYMKAPGKEHWEAAMRIFSYLMKTTHYKIRLGGMCAILYAYGDANLAGDCGGKSDTHRSMSGSVYFLGDGPIEWGASMQKRVALSTSAAEATAMYYTAVSQAEVNVLSFRDLLNEISCDQVEASYMFCDNKGAVEATHNPMTGKMRHINMKIHHLRESIELGQIKTILIGTDDMLADIFTKHLLRKRHEYLRRLTCGYGTSTDLERKDSKPGIPEKLKMLLKNGL
jgi:hypothetical protein